MDVRPRLISSAYAAGDKARSRTLSFLREGGTNVPDNLAVDGARDTVLQLEVHLGNRVLGEDGGVRDITDGGRLDHVANGESLDCLVLGRASRAVAAADGLDVAAALLVAAAVGERQISFSCVQL